jgi:hypothetical protein
MIASALPSFIQLGRKNRMYGHEKKIPGRRARCAMSKPIQTGAQPIQ